jgi:hypothetical protein
MTMHLDPRFVQLLGLPTCACGGTGMVQVTHVTADGLLHTSEPCPTCCLRCGGTGWYPEDDPETGDVVDRYGCPDCGTGGAA